LGENIPGAEEKSVLNPGRRTPVNGKQSRPTKERRPTASTPIAGTGRLAVGKKRKKGNGAEAACL